MGKLCLHQNSNKREPMLQLQPSISMASMLKTQTQMRIHHLKRPINLWTELISSSIPLEKPSEMTKRTCSNLSSSRTIPMRNAWNLWIRQPPKHGDQISITTPVWAPSNIHKWVKMIVQSNKLWARDASSLSTVVHPLRIPLRKWLPLFKCPRLSQLTRLWMIKVMRTRCVLSSADIIWN